MKKPHNRWEWKMYILWRWWRERGLDTATRIVPPIPNISKAFKQQAKLLEPLPLDAAGCFHTVKFPFSGFKNDDGLHFQVFNMIVVHFSTYLIFIWQIAIFQNVQCHTKIKLFLITVCFHIVYFPSTRQ